MRSRASSTARTACWSARRDSIPAQSAKNHAQLLNANSTWRWISSSPSRRAAVASAHCGSRAIRRANAIHPITALQTEYSLWTRHIEDEILATIRDLGIGLIPYSPLGRGFLTGKITSPDALAPDDFRRQNPRFVGDALAANLALVDRVRALADRKGVTPGQFALAWVLAQGQDVVPIPGTKRVSDLEENVAAASLALTDNDLAELEKAIPANAVVGERYPDMSSIDQRS